MILDNVAIANCSLFLFQLNCITFIETKRFQKIVDSRMLFPFLNEMCVCVSSHGKYFQDTYKNYEK